MLRFLKLSAMAVFAVMAASSCTGAGSVQSVGEVAESQYEVLSPWADVDPIPVRGISPRLDSVEGKKIGLFSYGSGCGAEFFVCQINHGISEIIASIGFKEQLENRKKLTFEQYIQFYSKSGEEILYYPEETKNFKNKYTRFVFTGFQGHKRQYM